MAPPRGALVDVAGRPLRLGAEIGRGGEGNVYEIIDAPQSVAKLYHEPADADKAAKLAAMVRGVRPALTDVAAWPTTTLHARGHTAGAGEPVVGLVMPRASGVPVHRLYSPISRRAEFPSVDWQRLVIVAHNLAAAMAGVHAAGHVIGDVNQGNVLVARDGRVRLIDCDSFQIRDGTRWYACEVGVGHFTPPELQGASSFAGIIRTPNHDVFGLAVLVFHLLFMGRHPFAGRYAGPGDMPLEQAIAEFRFAFGRNASSVQMSPPPNALPLASASPDVADLFERAFGRDGVRDSARPTAAEWKTVLGALAKDVAMCAVTPGHRYPQGLDACPWCAIAAAGGPDFFAPTPVTGQRLPGFDTSEVWNAIIAVPVPATRRPTPAGLPVPRTPTHPVARWRVVAWRGHQLVGFASGVALAAASTSGSAGGSVRVTAAGLLLLFVGLRRASGLQDARARRFEEADKADAQLRTLEKRWTREIGGADASFAAKRRELDALLAEHQALAAAKERRRRDVRASRREHQLQQYLAGHRIRANEVRGIGSARMAALASNGIQTAADVTYAALIAIPDLDPTRANALLVWRRLLEGRFRFDPSQPVDPAALAALETRMEHRRDAIERALAAGPAALGQLGGVVTRRAEQLAGEFRTQRVAVDVARANIAAVGGLLPARYRLPGRAAAVALAVIAGGATSHLRGHPSSADDTARRVAFEAQSAVARARAAEREPPRPPSAAQPTSDASSYFEFQVEKQAAPVPGSLLPTYPEVLRYSASDGKVMAQFVVDTTGLADMSTWKVLETTNSLFSQAVRDGVAKARFYPAEIGGKKVRQLVQLPFTFSLTR